MITEIMELLPEACPYFTVNNAVNYVNIINPLVSGVDEPRLLHNGIYKTLFKAGEGFNILSIGYMLPENFVMTELSTDTNENNPLISVFIQDSSSVNRIIEGFYAYGMYMYSENFEHVINKFVNPILTPTNVTTVFKLTAKFNYGVGNTNHPDKLNGRIFQIRPFVKIEHTLELT